MHQNNYVSLVTRFRTLFIGVLMLFHLTVFAQLKNPEIVFDVGSSLFSSTDQTFFSADNKYMAIADISNVNPAIKIIDLASSLPIKTIRGENNYWQVQFSSDFKYFRYNRLPTSDADSNRFEAVQNTFTGERIFRRKIEDARGGPKTFLFGDFVVVEKKDSLTIKSLDTNSPALKAPLGMVMTARNHLLFTPSYASGYINMFSSKTNTIRRIDFTKQNPALLTQVEKDDIGKNIHSSFFVKSYAVMADDRYVVALMESYSNDSELVKVFSLGTDSVVYSQVKDKLSDADQVFYGSLQFNGTRGTITYAAKDGLAVDNINKPGHFIIHDVKPGNEMINCGIDNNTGVLINWCSSFIKIYDPETGSIVYETKPATSSLAQTRSAAKFGDIKLNPTLPFLYVEKKSDNFGVDSTAVFDLRLKKFVKNAPCEIVAISPNGKYIYCRNKLRYCLMNEQLELIKYLNDCSLITTAIDEDDSDGDLSFKTTIDYLCEFSRSGSSQPDDKVFHWDIQKLQRTAQQPPDIAQLNLNYGTINKHGFKIAISSLRNSQNFPSLAVYNDTLVISRESPETVTTILFPKRIINGVDIDIEKKQILTISSADYTNYELGVYDFKGKPSLHYKINLKDNGGPYQVSLACLNKFAFLTSLSLHENEQLLTAYDLSNGNPITELSVAQGDYSPPSSATDLAYIHHNLGADTLFRQSLITGKQAVKRIKFNSFKNNLIVYFQPEDKWYQGNFLLYPENGKIFVEDWEKNQVIFEMDIKNDAIHDGVISPDHKLLAFPDRNGIITLVNLQTKKIITRFTGHTGEVRKLYFTQNGQYLFSSSDDGTLRLWDLKQNQEKLRVVNFGADGYIMLSPEGYYRSSKEAIKRFGYVAGNRVLDAGQLDIKYNRPDKVLQAIGSTDTALIRSYKKAYQKRIKKLGIDTAAFKTGYSLPEADFKNRDEITLEQTQGSLKLHIRGRDSIYILDRFNVWVNQCPIFGMRGISLRTRNIHLIDTTISIDLSTGENRIQTSVTNINGIESYKIPLYVDYRTANADSGRMYFIGIGINKFADKNYNLSWSVKDIRDLALKINQKYHGACQVDTLFDENVTTANVIALKKRLLKTGVNDKVIVAYSGHGLFNTDYDYFLSTYNVNFKDPAKNGLPYDDLENLLDSIPARKKLMLIDACHSGEIDKDEMTKYTITADSRKKNGVKDEGQKGAEIELTKKSGMSMASSFELMKELFANVGNSTGATVISAAGGFQYALEKNDLKNGVFSYCILEQMQQNPHVTISALKLYVNKRVTELTAGMQVPTTRNEPDAVDWQVW